MIVRTIQDQDLITWTTNMFYWMHLDIPWGCALTCGLTMINLDQELITCGKIWTTVRSIRWGSAAIKSARWICLVQGLMISLTTTIVQIFEVHATQWVRRLCTSPMGESQDQEHMTCGMRFHSNLLENVSLWEDGLETEHLALLVPRFHGLHLSPPDTASLTNQVFACSSPLHPGLKHTDLALQNLLAPCIRWARGSIAFGTEWRGDTCVTLLPPSPSPLKAPSMVSLRQSLNLQSPVSTQKYDFYCGGDEECLELEIASSCSQSCCKASARSPCSCSMYVIRKQIFF